MNQNDYLETEVLRRSGELDRMQDAVVFALASLAETRDPETGNHLLRTQHYVRVLAQCLATTDKYRDVLSPTVIDTYFKAAPLHDIGKVGIPDNILLKPGKLTQMSLPLCAITPCWVSLLSKSGETFRSLYRAHQCRKRNCHGSS